MGGYRPDIDGLRAVAVISVVLFHLGLLHLPGGFVGVDVFFVISGYLITRIITGEINQDRFSIFRFYERRARRILPALFMMMAVTTLLASIVMVPSTFRVFGASVVAAALSISNAFFWFTGGYFAVASSSRPLLHTWSLGVEEQYYVVFPILLILLRRYTRLSWVQIILPLALASLAFSMFQVRVSTRAAFYLPFSRFWELMVGSLLAVGAVRPMARPAVNEALGIAGLGLIATAVLLYSEDMYFPGESALVPCLGAALVIYSGMSGPTLVSRFLSLRPLVFIGLISYSLYLWHWPLIVLAQSFVLQRDLTGTETAVMMAVVTVVSILSWRFVERPFRHGSVRTSPVTVLRWAAGGMAAFAVVGVGLWVTHGLPGRFSQPVLQFAQAVEDKNPLREACDSRSPEDVRGGRVCQIGASGKEPTFAVVGDSFGDAMLPGIAAASRRGGDAGIVLTQAGCNPLFGVNQRNGECRIFMDAVADLLKRSDHIRSVVIVGRWTRMAEGSRFGAREMSNAFIMDDQSKTRSLAENKRVFTRAVARFSDTLQGKEIFIAAYFPEQVVNVPQAAFVEALMGETPDVAVPREVFDQRQRFVRSVLNDAARRRGIQVLDVGRHLCDSERCRATEDGKSLYADDNHLTRSTAIKYSQIFDPVFDDEVSSLQDPDPSRRSGSVPN